MSLSYYVGNLPSEGHKKAKAREVARKMKLSHEDHANNLMDIDNGIWKKMRIRSGSDMDERKLRPAYKQEVKRRVTGKVHKKVLDILTDNNFHSLRDAIEN